MHMHAVQELFADNVAAVVVVVLVLFVGNATVVVDVVTTSLAVAAEQFSYYWGHN